MYLSNFLQVILTLEISFLWWTCWKLLGIPWKSASVYFSKMLHVFVTCICHSCYMCLSELFHVFVRVVPYIYFSQSRKTFLFLGELVGSSLAFPGNPAAKDLWARHPGCLFSTQPLILNRAKTKRHFSPRKSIIITSINFEDQTIVAKSDIFRHKCSEQGVRPSVSRSVQRVPEPDPLPGISFDTRPDPIQF